MEAYNSSTDPCDHLERFKTLMILQEAFDALMCKSLPATFRDAAGAWYVRFSSDSISSFEKFGQKFIT